MTAHHEACRGPCFIVGNSRSGTTMMARILDRHRDAFAFSELHFYEQLWVDGDDLRVLTPAEAVTIGARLINNERRGYFYRYTDVSEFETEAREMLKVVGGQGTADDVFCEFLYYEAARHGASIPIEQTPRNLYYLDAILRRFPAAVVVVMVRDPRAVLLSQKGKWKRRRLGEPDTLRTETARAWFNYHPVVTSRLWNAAVDVGERWAGDSRVVTLHFESLVRDPEQALRPVCKALGIVYRPEMIQIPQLSSSNDSDSDAIGIRPERADRWRQGGLRPAEIWLCERITRDRMRRHGYHPSDTAASVGPLLAQIAALPLKLGGALWLNRGQSRSLAVAVRRRLQSR